MADRIPLTSQEQELFDDLIELVRQTRNSMLLTLGKYDEQEKRYAVMSQKAHELHMALKSDGHEPKHHKYCMKIVKCQLKRSSSTIIFIQSKTCCLLSTILILPKTQRILPSMKNSILISLLVVGAL